MKKFRYSVNLTKKYKFNKFQNLDKLTRSANNGEEVIWDISDMERVSTVVTDSDGVTSDAEVVTSANTD